RGRALVGRAGGRGAGARFASGLGGVRVRVVGRSGELTALLRSLGAVPASERPLVGQEANRAKAQIEAVISARLEELRVEEHRRALAASPVHLTPPGPSTPPP